MGAVVDLHIRNLNRILDGCQWFLGMDPRSGVKQVLEGDSTTLCVLGVKWLGPTPYGYVVEWCGGRWKTSKAIDKLFELTHRWKPRKLFLETNTGGDWLVDPVRRRGKELGFDYLPIEEVKQSKALGAKDERIENSLETPYAYHQIAIARHLEGGEGENQLFRWQPGGVGHNDYVDVLAMTWQHATKHRYGSQIQGRNAGPVVARTWKARYKSTRV
jgi:hypothetical protein